MEQRVRVGDRGFFPVVVLLALIALLAAPELRAQTCDPRVPFAGHQIPLDQPLVFVDYTTADAFPGLQSMDNLLLANAGDGSDRLFVVRQSGSIVVFPNDPGVTQGQAAIFLDLAAEGVIETGGERGLHGLAFDPDFANTQSPHYGHFYVHYSAPVAQCSCKLSGTCPSLLDHCSKVVRFAASPHEANSVDPGTAFELLEIEQPRDFHNGGMLAFGPDGMLYISVGDGGRPPNGQDTGTLLGGILRLDPHAPAPHVPPDNPFGTALWHYGFRNPWRFTFDREPPHDMWIGDVGQSSYEEIDHVPGGTPGGLNFGWKICEGTHDFQGNCSALGAELPVYEYGRSDGRAVIGGYVYRGSALPALYGHYVFGDYGSGTIWAWDRVTLDPDTGLAAVRPLASTSQLAGFGEDEAGELYLLKVSGGIEKLVPAGPPGGGVFPQKLSETGFFSDTASLTPEPGLIEYAVASKLWSDRATKRRWLALPGSAQITFVPTGGWVFPVGTALLKHFELPKPGGGTRRLETRVLLLQNGGQWLGLTYHWDEAQSDADLLTAALTEVIEVEFDGIPQQQAWTYPSPTNCLACHTASAGWVLGPRTRQLNFVGPQGDNQLEHWNCLGLFDTDVGASTQYEAFTSIDDDSASRQHRARSYLATNCSICHEPEGSAPGGMDMRFGTLLGDMDLIGVLARHGDLGISNPERIKPGAHAGSVLWHRMQSLDPAVRMAEGTRVPHEDAVLLFADWIDLDLTTLDSDEDGWEDASDNCPGVPNTGQDDRDGDGLGDACDPDTSFCGDGAVDPGEQCDDGNTAPGDGCSATCQDEVCGNGTLDPGEQCDDGNTTPGDGCSATCQEEVCGNGTVDPGEQCDDGNTAPGDSCSATCQDEVCGNGTVDPSEQCDDGNTVPGDGCSATCQDEVCGDGTVDPGEQCDDGNTTPGDGCSAACQDEVCGNGVQGPDEQCDDGNTADGDCCSASCTLEPAGTVCAEDGDQCTQNICDGAGTCTHPLEADGFSCADGDPCTAPDTCSAGVCGGTALPDADVDGLCDAQDSDDDNDAVDDVDDAFPFDATRCRDVDADGCDDCSGGASDPFNDGPDFDSDGICESERYAVSVRDNTLYEDPEGDVSNGAGEHLFAGVAADGSLRRGLLSFDVGAAIPAGSTVHDVALTLNMSRTIAGAEDVGLHVALADWGEAGSDAPGEEGGGTLALPGDATWLHNFMDTSSWSSPGGDLSATASAVQTVGPALGYYTWSSPQMVADVQGWLDDPSTDFGWVVVGDEGTGGLSAQRFDSRENAVPANQPQLWIHYSPSSQLPDPVAYYSFDAGSGGVAVDDTGHGHDGTLNGPSWTTQGRFGNALLFDGVDDVVLVPDASPLDLAAELTLMAWVHPTAALSGWRSVVHKEGNPYFLHASSPSGGPGAGIANDRKCCTILETSTAIPVDAWTHLALSYDGAQMTYYVDGVAIATVPATGLLKTNGDPLWIGSINYANEAFTGRIDEVRLYEVALSPSEIQVAMGLGVVPDTTDPTVTLTAPADGATVSGTLTVAADATDDAGVAGVQFLLDGSPLGAEVLAPPYEVVWDTSLVANGSYTLSATARDAAGNAAFAPDLVVTVDNAVSLPDPVAYYSFDAGSGGVAVDDTGHGHDGTLNGPSWTTQGRFGSALVFDGVDDAVLVPDATPLDLAAELTLMAWVHPTAALSGWRSVVHKGGNPYFLHASSPSVGPGAGIANDRKCCTILETSTAIPVDAWTHLAVIYDGAQMTYYVDGVVVGAVPATGLLKTNGDPLWIGSINYANEAFTGRIDEVRLYEVALSPSEIQVAMGLGVMPDTTDPTVTLTAPADGATVSGTLAVTADATDDVGVAGVQFYLDGAPLGAEALAAPYQIAWDTSLVANGSHTLSATARDAAGNAAFVPDVVVTVDNAVLLPDPVAYYSFDAGSGGVAVDDTGHGHDGTLNGPSWTTQGRFGSALVFDGVDDAVLVPDATPLDLAAELTLMAWVHPTAALSGWRSVVHKEGNPYFLHASSPSGGPGAGIANDRKCCTILETSTAIPVDAWTHLALSYDGAQMTYYVDGVAVATVPATGLLKTNGDPLWIGSINYANEAFTGRIDEVRLYEVALSPSLIKVAMGSGVGPDTTDPVITLTAPADGATVSGTLAVTADATDDVGVAGVQFYLDGAPLGAEVLLPPFTVGWHTLLEANGVYALSARAWDAAGNAAFAPDVVVTVDNAVPLPDPVAYYSFDAGSGGVAVDDTGQGHDGTLNGPSWTTQGRFGNALVFDGVDDVVLVPDASPLDLAAELTLMAWVHPTAALIGWRSVVHKEGNPYFLHASSPSGGPGAGIANDRTCCTILETSTAIPADAWTHLAVTYDGAQMTYYVDGVAVTTVPATGQLKTNGDPLWIGSINYANEAFAGRIDEVRLYDVALSQSEIQALRDSANPGP